MLPAATLRLLVQEKVAVSARRNRAWFLPSIRQQTSHPMPQPPHTPLFSFTEIHGWSSLERATPLSIRTLTVELLHEALKVSSRRHWRFLLSQTLLNFGRPALPAAIAAAEMAEICDALEDMCSLG